VRRLCLLGVAFSAEQVHLECAGAVVCEPGAVRDRAEGVIAVMGGAGAAALRLVKARLWE
jgi:hypothetical protein